jgi:hypothetical protein
MFTSERGVAIGSRARKALLDSAKRKPVFELAEELHLLFLTSWTVLVFLIWRRIASNLARKSVDAAGV